MKPTGRLGAIAAAVLLVLAAPVLAAAPDRAAKPDTRIAFDAGNKWKTDAAIRRGMASIREQVAGVRDASCDDPVRARHYAALGESIKREVREMHAASTMGPEADRNFHFVVNQLLIAAHTLEGKTRVEPGMGLEQAELVVAQYAVFFEHPGWTA